MVKPANSENIRAFTGLSSDLKSVSGGYVFKDTKLNYTYSEGSTFLALDTMTLYAYYVDSGKTDPLWHECKADGKILFTLSAR